MRNYLLDTNVICEIGKRNPNPVVSAWEKQVDSASLYLSVLTLGEINAGIEKLKHKEPQRSASFQKILDYLQVEFRYQTLPVCEEVASEWGRMSLEERQHPVDRLFAATAKVHNMTLVTRNVKHVNRHNIPLLNPFIQ